MHVFCIIRMIGTLFGLSIFLIGYFPLKQVSKTVSLSNQKICVNPTSSSSCKKNVTIPHETYSEVQNIQDVSSSHLPYKKIIFMIIDAFRSDFYFGPYKRMPRTSKLFEKGYGIKFVAEAHPPTVTMPRIKVSIYVEKNICV